MCDSDPNKQILRVNKNGPFPYLQLQASYQLSLVAMMTHYHYQAHYTLLCYTGLNCWTLGQSSSHFVLPVHRFHIMTT